MNSNKTILTLLLIIAILGGVFALQQWLTAQDGQESQTYLKQFENFSKENITEIKLVRSDQALNFKKENDHWLSDHALIDTTIVSSLLANLTAPSEVILISQNSEQHATYEVTPEKATTVSLINSTGEKKILVGAPTSGNYYVRFDGSNDVWGVQTMTNQIADLSLSQWLDKKLLAVDEENINTLVLEKSGSLLTLQQRNKNWFIDGGEQPLDKTAFSDLIMQLESLEAIGMINDETIMDFPTKPALKLTVNSQGTTPITLEFFTGKDTILAKMSDRPGNFEVSQSTFDDLNVDRSEIVFAPTPTQAQ